MQIIKSNSRRLNKHSRRLNRHIWLPGPAQLPVLVLIAAILLAGCGPGLAQAGRTDPSVVAVPPTSTPTILADATATSTHPPQPTQTATSTAAPPASPSPTPSPTADPALISVPAGRVKVPILLYHHVRDEAVVNSKQKLGRYDMPLADFRVQMQALADGGYQTITISQLAEVIRSGGQLPVKPVVLTFDDGYSDTYQYAFPVLQEHGFQATVYVIGQTQEKEKSYGYMQAAELKALIAAGWEIGSHSISHSSLKTSRLGMRNEIEKSKQDLEALLGVPIRSFSYPFGIANQWIEDRVAEYGYESAVGLDIMVSQSPKRLYYLSRREVQRGTSLTDFKALLVPGQEEMAWLKILTQTPEPAAP